jgi:hypothetical protein
MILGDEEKGPSAQKLFLKTEKGLEKEPMEFLICTDLYLMKYRRPVKLKRGSNMDP